MDPAPTPPASAPHAPIRIVIADGHPALVAGLVAYFAATASDFEVVGSGHTLADAERLVSERRPHAALVGATLSGPRFPTFLRWCARRTRLVVLGGDAAGVTEDGSAGSPLEILGEGAAGYVSRGAELVALAAALRAAALGHETVALDRGDRGHRETHPNG